MRLRAVAPAHAVAGQDQGVLRRRCGGVDRQRLGVGVLNRPRRHRRWLQNGRLDRHLGVIMKLSRSLHGDGGRRRGWLGTMKHFDALTHRHLRCQADDSRRPPAPADAAPNSRKNHVNLQPIRKYERNDTKTGRPAARGLTPSTDAHPHPLLLHAFGPASAIGREILILSHGEPPLPTRSAGSSRV